MWNKRNGQFCDCIHTMPDRRQREMSPPSLSQKVSSKVMTTKGLELPDGGHPLETPRMTEEWPHYPQAVTNETKEDTTITPNPKRWRIQFNKSLTLALAKWLSSRERERERERQKERKTERKKDRKKERQKERKKRKEKKEQNRKERKRQEQKRKERNERKEKRKNRKDQIR